MTTQSGRTRAKTALAEEIRTQEEQLAFNHGKRIGILIVAYNAVTTLSQVLKRIPAPVWANVEQVAVFDDASQDATYELAVGLKALNENTKLQVLKQAKNLGYGGNQKAGYKYFIEQGFDVVVLLHGDGQYAPEVLARMYHGIVTGQCDAIFGSRMMKDFGGPLKGGMPLYKYLGNRVLTHFENRALALNLTEFHSGYRAYNLHSLAQIDFSRMTDDFHFDTEIIIKLHHQGFKIHEVPIPTFYGDEICYVNGMRYAKDILRAVYRYDRTRRSIQCYPEYQEYYQPYRIKTESHSSHAYARVAVGRGQDVLEVAHGVPSSFGVELAKAGNRVTYAGPVSSMMPGVESAIQADASCGLAAVLHQTGPAKFDKILLLDVLEHFAEPERALQDTALLLKPNGSIVVSIPNVANLTVRLMVLFGMFEYHDRGILDRTHLRFYTRRTAERLIESCGFEVTSRQMTIVPVGILLGGPKFVVSALRGLLIGLTALMPGLLGYQTFLTAQRKQGG